VKSSFDTRNTNGGRGCDAVRLAGQWVSRRLAIYLAPAYGIQDLVAALARASPDPNVAYRKSQRSQAASDELNRQRTEETARDIPVPSLTSDVASPVPKRQRRQSPLVGTPTATTGRTAPSGDAESRHLTLEATSTVTAPIGTQVDMDAEIQSAKQLVMDLKRELRLRAAVGEELEDMGYDAGEATRGVKRTKGQDESVVISGSGSKDRVVKKNKRVQQGVLGENTKRMVWGAAIFGLGVTAASFLPQVVSNYF